MIQTKDSNLTFRPLTIDDAEQYNALLRYAFQVTEQLSLIHISEPTRPY